MSKSSDKPTQPTQPKTEIPKEIPEEFVKVIYDLINDILFSFPEFKENLNLELHNIKETRDEESVLFVYEHIKRVFPERFFDILYKNEEMFSNDDINTEFLPGIDFKNIWKAEISVNTKDTLWKYLQIILFSVIGKVDSHESFGETAKMFESINEDDLKQKLEETLHNLQNMMGGDGPIDVSGINLDQLPNPDDIQGHINGLLDGKLGKLAKEIAAETAAELNIDAENATSVNDVFQNLFKNPGKLMSLVQNVGGKLDSKIKSGEIKESELMKEASDLLGKMKDLPGMGDIQSLMKNMGLGKQGGNGGGRGGMGDNEMATTMEGMMGNMGGMADMLRMAGLGGFGGGKPNLGAMSNALNQNMKKAQMKEEILKRAAYKTAQKKAETDRQTERLALLPPSKPMTDEELEQIVFSIEGDKPEKSMRPNNSANKDKKKKKKGKN